MIDNYTSGANDPDIIDSIRLISFAPPSTPAVERPAPENPAPAVVNRPVPQRTVEPVKPAEKPASLVPQPVMSSPLPKPKKVAVQFHTEKEEKL